jgi:hypothetical protein
MAPDEHLAVVVVVVWPFVLFPECVRQAQDGCALGERDEYAHFLVLTPPPHTFSLSSPSPSPRSLSLASPAVSCCLSLHCAVCLRVRVHPELIR